MRWVEWRELMLTRNCRCCRCHPPNPSLPPSPQAVHVNAAGQMRVLVGEVAVRCHA